MVAVKEINVRQSHTLYPSRQVNGLKLRREN